MGRALITGATGFIGGHLVEALLRRGDHVRCLVRETSDTSWLEQLDVELVRARLDQSQDLKECIHGVDVVYHLAALTMSIDSAQLYRVNTVGSACLAAACAAQSSPPVLVYVSSVAAAGPTGRDRVRHETDPAAPVSHYGRSKRGGELATYRWAGSVPSTIVRPGIVFGERNRDMLPAFQAIRQLRVHAVPSLTPPRLSLIHVEDLVELILRAADRGHRLQPESGPEMPSAEGVYFACSPEYPTYADLGSMIADGLGCRPFFILMLPQPLPWLVGAANQFVGYCRGKIDPVNVDKMREASVDSWACSGQRASDELGFAPRRTNAQRFATTASWYVEHGWV